MNIQHKNFVSIWCGKFANEDEFLQYLEMDYDSDDNSQFMQDFLIDWYDKDLSECGFYTGDLFKNLMQHSYAESFPLSLKKDIENYLNCNSVLLIYDFVANPQLANKTTKLHLLGVYAYDKNRFATAFNMP